VGANWVFTVVGPSGRVAKPGARGAFRVAEQGDGRECGEKNDGAKARAYGVGDRIAPPGQEVARPGFESVPTVWTGGKTLRPGQAVRTPTKPAVVQNAFASAEVNTLAPFV
jgi:hypothetical protein